MQRTIHQKVVLPYKPELVWEAITDSKWLGKWFMANDFIPEINREFTFRMAPQKGWDGITYCKVIELEPLKKVVYTYQGSASGEKALACAGIHSEAADKVGKGIFTKLDTVLKFTLESTCGGTILSMEHSGYKGLKLVMVSFIMGMGWKKQLRKKMPIVLAQIAKTNIQ
jgi:uncharacterized protein YndB with AHSA1/START domain